MCYLETGEMRDGFHFDSIVWPFNKYDAIDVVVNKHSKDDYVKYINEHQIEQARIVMPDLEILYECPGLRKLNISPSYNAPEIFDFSPLYTMEKVESLQCDNEYGEQRQHVAYLDCSRLKGVLELSVSANKGVVNYNKIDTLKTLRIGGFKGAKNDLTDLFSSKEIDTLELIECKEKSLDGIERSEKMQCLYISYNRLLEDISALKNVKKTLKALRIDKCPKIKDFSVLAELENLELLELCGSNTLPNLHFLKSLRNLKTFIFDYNIKDGDITPCIAISYVYCMRGRKHYNLKDKDLPKGEYVRGNEDIEAWRRLE